MQTDRLLRAIFFATLSAASASQAASAAAVPPDDLFFAPASLVEDVYPVQPLTGDGVTSPWEATWTDADILALDPDRVDITFVGVEVLPVLVENPSPASEEGEYTDADLAAIDVSNYTSFYLQQPGLSILDSGTDYAADLTPSQVTLSITAPAVYAVRIRTQSRPGAGQPLEDVAYVFSQFVGDHFGERKEKDDHGVQRKVSMYDTDCYVVALPDRECVGGDAPVATPCAEDADCPDTKRCDGGTNDGAICTGPGNCPGGSCKVVSQGICNEFNANAAQNLSDAGKTSPDLCRAGTVAAAEQCIQDCKAAHMKCAGGTHAGQTCNDSADCQNGICVAQKVSVTMIGHGYPGGIGMGAEEITNGPGGAKTPGEFQEAIDACVDEIRFFSCNVGSKAAGAEFVNDVGASIPDTRATVNTVSAARKSTYAGKPRPGYWNEFAKAKRTKASGARIPALGSGPLIGMALAIGVCGLLVIGWRRAGTH